LLRMKAKHRACFNSIWPHSKPPFMDAVTTAEPEIFKMGIPLTQVGPISSMPGWGQKSIRGM